MKDWKQRVIDEEKQLAERLEKLGAFFVSFAWPKVTNNEKQRLRVQFQVMQEYRQVLLDRIRNDFQ